MKGARAERDSFLEASVLPLARQAPFPAKLGGERE